ncbi:MAG: RDD family protein [Nanoarchaeota archaeon]
MARLNLPKEKLFIGPALLWKRIAAFLIDLAIINLIILLPFRSLLAKIFPADYSFSEALKLLSSTDNAELITLVSSMMGVFIMLYFYLLEKKMHQSIGKRIMKIYVASDSKELKFWQVLVRNLVFLPLFPFFLLWILDPLFMLFTKTNQRLSEILSKTKVIGIYTLEP